MTSTSSYCLSMLWPSALPVCGTNMLSLNYGHIGSVAPLKIMFVQITLQCVSSLQDRVLPICNHKYQLYLSITRQDVMCFKLTNVAQRRRQPRANAPGLMQKWRGCFTQCGGCVAPFLHCILRFLSLGFLSCSNVVFLQ